MEMENENERHHKSVQQIQHSFTRNIPWCLWQSKVMKVSKLTTMDVGNYF
ncbi:hypothetical protein Goshw_000139 [Gossypium schwendimanii]|uniref:Uncharacterized protein n=1 Tax=Gossypium schwendimanii TaxID=34291 RepID=A0A7J9N8A0_GOSSC|nr:hypothetical protein [Gossypium schwendimanii]